MVKEDFLKLLAYNVDYDRDGKEKSRKILQTVRNFETILENDERFAGKIKFDEFSQQTYLAGNTMWELNGSRAWSSYDDSALFSSLQSDYGMKSRNDYFDAVKNVSMRNKFHPVRETLDAFKWDGVERIRRLLPDYLGVEDTEYSYQVMRLIMLGAIERVYMPGCKFDYTLTLVGPQGLGKSTFLRKLALRDEWFNDSLDSLDTDRAAQSIMGSWIIELAELKSLARTAGGADSVKRFLTATQDKLRLPYERRTDVFLRQCVFCGTTNKSDFLQDETGNRRFLVVQTGINKPQKSLFTPEAVEDIKAAWAEAVHIWKTEKPVLVLPDSCREEARRLQEDSTADDGKVGIITDYLADKQRTCAIEIWQKALGEQGRPQKWQAGEINNIILSLPGWERIKSAARFGEFGTQKGFQKMSTNSSQKCQPEPITQDGFISLDAESQMELPFD
ncbi:MAG: virulence-associated E family protein [Lachnospiraceae bacterium]|nr:virulence-associated E family protein [Lachnospiraceae bacterium]